VLLQVHCCTVCACQPQYFLPPLKYFRALFAALAAVRLLVRLPRGGPARSHLTATTNPLSLLLLVFSRQMLHNGPLQSTILVGNPMDGVGAVESDVRLFCVGLAPRFGFPSLSLFYPVCPLLCCCLLLISFFVGALYSGQYLCHCTKSRETLHSHAVRSHATKSWKQPSVSTTFSACSLSHICVLSLWSLLRSRSRWRRSAT
jgi:hypothetical protein